MHGATKHSGKNIFWLDKALTCDKLNTDSCGNVLQLFTWALDDYQQKLVLWRNQDLMLLGADSEEGEVILRVDVPHCAPGLHRELVKNLCILN